MNGLPRIIISTNLKSHMQHFSFIVVNFNICRQVNKPETVTVSHQAPVKKRKPTVNSMCDYQNRGHLDKVDQLDDGKITIQSRKLVDNHNYHGTKSTTWIEINQLRTIYFCDLVNPLNKAYVS